jgi:DNA ligase 1
MLSKEPERKSNRVAEKSKPFYNEKEVEEAYYSGKGSGKIDVMLAQTYDAERDDPSGWLMSEKLDGVRCYWNGSNLYTRNGNKIFAPKEWKD